MTMDHARSKGCKVNRCASIQNIEQAVVVTASRGARVACKCEIETAIQKKLNRNQQKTCEFIKSVLDSLAMQDIFYETIKRYFANFTESPGNGMAATT